MNELGVLGNDIFRIINNSDRILCPARGNWLYNERL